MLPNIYKYNKTRRKIKILLVNLTLILTFFIINTHITHIPNVSANQTNTRRKPQSTHHPSKSFLNKQCSHLKSNNNLFNYLSKTRPSKKRQSECGSTKCCRDPIWSIHRSKIYVLMSKYKTIYWKEKIQEEFDSILDSLNRDIERMFGGEEEAAADADGDYLNYDAEYYYMDGIYDGNGLDRYEGLDERKKRSAEFKMTDTKLKDFYRLLKNFISGGGGGSGSSSDNPTTTDNSSSSNDDKLSPNKSFTLTTGMTFRKFIQTSLSDCQMKIPKPPKQLEYLVWTIRAISLSIRQLLRLVQQLSIDYRPEKNIVCNDILTSLKYCKSCHGGKVEQLLGDFLHFLKKKF